jgi:hypothetical protein
MRHPITLVVLTPSFGLARDSSADCVGLSKSLARELSSAATVFVADVLDVEDHGQLVRFNVLEGIKNAVPGERILRLNAEVHAFRFQLGQRVLVFAYPEPGGSDLTTSCSATRLVTLKDQELLRLQKMARQFGYLK